MKKFIVCCFSLTSLLFAGCEKEDNTPDEACLITELYFTGGENDTRIKITYDAQNRITRIGEDDGYYRYIDEKIIYRSDYDGALDSTVFHLGSNNLVKKSEIYSGNELVVTSNYVYDANNYLVSATSSNVYNGESVFTYTYVNGNLTKVDEQHENGTSYTEFEYHDNLLSNSWFLQCGHPFGPEGYMPWMGKTNKNLIKSIRMSDSENPRHLFEYEIDSRGFVVADWDPRFSGKREIVYQCK